MDLDGNGTLDILSGSYSRLDGDMAGLFQVLWGEKDGTFRSAQPLEGSDGQALLLPHRDSKGPDLDRICTRPFAADLDGDGKLDLVAGNFAGKFASFHGLGGGKFEPQGSYLEAGGKPMRVKQHGDPFLVDWDGDRDLDLLSGSAQGGAFLFVNEGTSTAPSFAASRTLIEPADLAESSNELGDAHLEGPSDSTRVWADDLNGDGKLDLLLGDNVTLYHASKGVEAAVARAKLAEWNEAVEKLSEEAGDDFGDRYEELEARRDEYVVEDRTGFVWVFYRQ